jgi:serine/threonine protein kinase
MKKIGRYQIRGLLGRGGMSTVYKVAMPTTGRIVALKLLSPAQPVIDLLDKAELIRIFTAEAVIMAGLRHPHIADIRDFDEDDQGRPFYVMEYYCKNLGALIGEHFRVEERSRIIEPDKVLHYGLQILDGLSCLHQAGIVHRDIKPYNILVTDQDTIKICDFGLSKLRGETRGRPRNLQVGSPFYAPPEQERAPEGVDGRADLYSCAVMLYRMLTGELPDGKRKPSQLNRLLDEEWDLFLATGLASSREHRFPDAKAMRSALLELQKHWEESKEKTCALLGPESVRNEVAVDAPVHILRSRPIKIDPRTGRNTFQVDSLWRPRHYITNRFEDNRDGTVIDRACGLVWQQAGSDYPLTWDKAQEFVQTLNAEGTAGRNDWRLPTVDELLSLLTEVSIGEQYCIAPVFDRRKRWLWSVDKRSFIAAWYVSVDLGFVGWQDMTCYNYVRAVCSFSGRRKG